MRTLLDILTYLRLFRHTFNISVITIMEGVFRPKCRERIDRRIQGWSGNLLKVVKCDYEVIHKNDFHFEPGRAHMLMCNHASNFDIPLTIHAFIKEHSIRMLAKKELFRIPIWGKAMKKAEFLFIDRQDKEAAKLDLEIAKKKMQDGVVLWVAPEGTRSRTGRLLPFKMGGFKMAMETEAIIHPMGIIGAGDIMQAGTLHFQPGIKAKIITGTPIDSRNFTNRKELAQAVRTAILELTGQEEETEA